MLNESGLPAVASTVKKAVKGDYEAIGSLTAVAVVGGVTSKAAGKLGTVATETAIANPVPKTVARVIPADVEATTLGAPSATDVFVTAADDIKGLNAKEIANKLTIPESESGFKVYEFDTPEGIASPFNRDNPGFINGGKTAGGAREFTVPNQEIPNTLTPTIVK